MSLAMSTALRPLTRSYAVADLNAMEPKPVSNVIWALDSKKRKVTDDGDETDHLSTGHESVTWLRSDHVNHT